MFKVTMKGQLDFMIPKTYDMVTAHFQKRLETYYKMDIALKGDDYFKPDTLNFVVPRMEHLCNIEKTWKNTIGLLNEIRTYSVAGALYVWVQNEKNQLVASECFLPVGDKVATTEYLKASFCRTKVSKRWRLRRLRRRLTSTTATHRRMNGAVWRIFGWANWKTHYSIFLRVIH